MTFMGRLSQMMSHWQTASGCTSCSAVFGSSVRWQVAQCSFPMQKNHLRTVCCSAVIRIVVLVFSNISPQLISPHQRTSDLLITYSPFTVFTSVLRPNCPYYPTGPYPGAVIMVRPSVHSHPALHHRPFEQPQLSLRCTPCRAAEGDTCF